jgi:response regulator NasT
MSATALARVLTVDDDPIVRADLRLILEDAGFSVCADARDGVEAIEFARLHTPDLVLIDLGLPRVDGVEATRQILSERAVPVVALTGHTGGDFLQRAVDAGAVEHVVKPFSESDLVGALRRALAARSAADRAAAGLVDEEYERRVLLTMVESMSRRGFSASEITRELQRASVLAADPEHERRGLVRGTLLGWLGLRSGA